jgi:hypothetical protein
MGSWTSSRAVALSCQPHIRVRATRATAQRFSATVPFATLPFEMTIDPELSFPQLTCRRVYAHCADVAWSFRPAPHRPAWSLFRAPLCQGRRVKESRWSRLFRMRRRYHPSPGCPHCFLRPGRTRESVRPKAKTVLRVRPLPCLPPYAGYLHNVHAVIGSIAADGTSGARILAK